MEAVSEEMVPRGNDANRQYKTLTVYIPTTAKNVKVTVQMRNEVWGGAQHPPKGDTDDLGTSHYIDCPQGSGDCPIAWSSVSKPAFKSLPNGMTEISAVFYNWAGRNDRWARLAVIFD